MREMRGAALRPPNRHPHKPQSAAAATCPRSRISSLRRQTQSCTPSIENRAPAGLRGGAGPGLVSSQRVLALRPSSTANAAPEARAPARGGGVRKDNSRPSLGGPATPRPRPSSATVRQPGHTDDGASAPAARRRPPHVQALLHSRAQIRRAASAASAEDAARALVRCRASAADLRMALHGATSRVDFAVLDRAVAVRGDGVLEGLRAALQSLHALSSSFFVLASADPEAASQDPPRAEAPNAIAVKALLVSLRGIADRMPTQFVASKQTALDLCEMLEQGLLEQILSWCSEAMAVYAVIHQAFRNMPLASRPSAVKSKPAQGAGRRMQATMLAERLRRAEEESSSSSGKSVSPASRDAEVGVRRQDCDDLFGAQKRKQRMQHFRPPRIIIPETSFEKKSMRRQ